MSKAVRSGLDRTAFSMRSDDCNIHDRRLRCHGPATILTTDHAAARLYRKTATDNRRCQHNRLLTNASVGKVAELLDLLHSQEGIKFRHDGQPAAAVSIDSRRHIGDCKHFCIRKT